MSDNMVPSSAECLGNSKSRTQREVPRNRWCFTWNNYTERDYLQVVPGFFKTYCSEHIQAREVGESGTPHIQGAFILKKKVRLASLITRTSPNVRFFPMKGTTFEAFDYCRKADPDYIETSKLPKPYLGEDIITYESMYDWQKELTDICLNKPDPRIIYWYYSLDGNKGKSAWCKYMIHHHDAVGISGGKKTDVLNRVYNSTKRECFIMDVPRTSVGISYNAIEDIKNGVVHNDKYETGSVLFSPPHIIILANFYPDLSLVSEDRWNIKNIGRDDPRHPILGQDLIVYDDIIDLYME